MVPVVSLYGGTLMLNDTNFKVKEHITGERKSKYFEYLNRIMGIICREPSSNKYTERYFLHLLCLQDVIIGGESFPKSYFSTPFAAHRYLFELNEQGYLEYVDKLQFKVTDKAISLFKKYMAEKDSTDPEYFYRKTISFINFANEDDFSSVVINFMLYLLVKNHPESLTRKDIVRHLGRESLFNGRRGKELYLFLESKGYIKIEGNLPYRYTATEKLMKYYGNALLLESDDIPKGDNEMATHVPHNEDTPQTLLCPILTLLRLLIR